MHKSIFPNVKMVWHGKSIIMFNNSPKILFWEFSAKLQNGVDTLKDQWQNRVWNLGGSKSLRLMAIELLYKSDRPHRQESMETFPHGESDSGASCSNFVAYLVDLGGDVFLNYFINYAHFERKICVWFIVNVLL